MQISQIRSNFLEFFGKNDHQIIPSASLIPVDDPSLLFVNSGMVPLKERFLGGSGQLHDFLRVTSAQRSLRAGGKHNDLENVGYTTRHHTFFEMLGNFSFGDYFKREAIHYAWELLTQVYGIEKNKLLITVYAQDNESYDIWHKNINVPDNRIIRIGNNKGAAYASDNFWQMADTGPCGPCSEIFYDHGPNVQGGLPGSKDADGDRYVEIWNLVFMQFNRDAAGKLTELPKPCIDTGMGLERIAAVLQGVTSNYEIDLFKTLIASVTYYTKQTDSANPSLKVIADHIRACAFLICDGVLPDNTGRGYILRRIIRRSIRHGYKLGCRNPFFYLLLDDLCQIMGTAYPELLIKKNHIAKVLHTEEISFFETIASGMNCLAAELGRITKIPSIETKTTSAVIKTLSGTVAFKLHDTYGFPLDLTQDICREHNVAIKIDEFESCMEQQRLQARNASKFKTVSAVDYQGAPSAFIGYTDLFLEKAVVLAIYVNGMQVTTINASDYHDDASISIILDKTPFYAQSGGQVGDIGILYKSNSMFKVGDTQKIGANGIAHIGMLESGQIKVGDNLIAEVNTNLRIATMRNHSATHLLHKALRDIVSQNVMQKGSLVDINRTRFDFSHSKPVTEEELRLIEDQVNQEILKNTRVQTTVMDFTDAIQTGAMALFGEKYTDKVRVLEIGSSKELCGGTHVNNTAEIGFFKIIVERAVAAGIRRIEAITGTTAIAYINKQSSQIELVAQLLKTKPENILAKITQLQEEGRLFKQESDALKIQLGNLEAEKLLSSVISINVSSILNNISVLCAVVAADSPNALRHILGRLKNNLGISVIVLTAITGKEKMNMIASVSKELTHLIQAGRVVSFIAEQLGGQGGGRDDMAQGGAVTKPEKLPEAITKTTEWLSEKLHQSN